MSEYKMYTKINDTLKWLDYIMEDSAVEEFYKTIDRTTQYQNNKEALVGEEIICPVCGKKFKKKQYSQAFCCLECKDRYWNDERSKTKNRVFNNEDLFFSNVEPGEEIKYKSNVIQ